MSLVVFPFKVEDPQIVVGNLRTAAQHEMVSEVLCIASSENPTYQAVSDFIASQSGEPDTPIRLVVQERIGFMRPGKGDAMNTALKWFLECSDSSRLHFYDADITNFGPDWISQAEETADRGFQVVRHYFPRASTDAMITWMITRPGLAMCWPDTVLPNIGQPLGGELLLTREAAQVLVECPEVQAQSDWGIDTRFTIHTASAGLGIAENYISQGKLHRLYGPLSDIKDMVVECFAALQAARSVSVPTDVKHFKEPAGPVSEEITSKIAYSVSDSVGLLRQGWTDRQMNLLEFFDAEAANGLAACRQYPRLGFLDAELWGSVYKVMLTHFDLSDPDWRELLFRFWVARVLSYTTTEALKGYTPALTYLEQTITAYHPPHLNLPTR